MLYKAFQLSVDYVTDEVIVTGDYALVIANSKGNTFVRANDKTIPVENKELVMLRKGNGQWKISYYMFNDNKMK